MPEEIEIIEIEKLPKFTLDPDVYRKCVHDTFDDLIDQCTIKVEGKNRVDMECLESKFKSICTSGM